MSALDSTSKDMYGFAGEPPEDSQPVKKAGSQCHAEREPHHLTPRELAWRPDPHSQSESARHWRTANEQSRKEQLRLSADGTYAVTDADSLSTIAERSLRGQGIKLTGKAIHDEMARLVELNRDAYPDLSRNLHLLKRGMALRMKADGCSENAGAEKEHHEVKQRNLEEEISDPGQPRAHRGHERAIQADAPAEAVRHRAPAGDQLVRSVLPIMAGLFGNAMLGGGHHYLQGSWRHGMMGGNEMIWNRGGIGSGADPRFYNGLSEGGFYPGRDPRFYNFGRTNRYMGAGGYMDPESGYNGLYSRSRAPWYYGDSGYDGLSRWG